MTTQTIRNGTSIDVPIPTGQTLKVVAVTGTYTITVTRGTGIGTALATAATGGSYGAYAYDSVVRIVASSASEIDFDVAVTPDVATDTVANYAFDHLTGAVTGLAGPGGYPFPTGVIAPCKTIAFLGDSLAQAGSFGLGALAYNKPTYYTTPTFTQINSTGNLVCSAQADGTCGAGTATLTWSPGGAYGSFVFTAPGDTAGASTAITGDGFLYVPSGTTGKGVSLALRTKYVDTLTVPSVTKTDTWTLSGNPSMSDHILDGYSAWADLLTNCSFPNHYNFGISGDTPENCYNRVAQVLAVSPDLVVELSGTNGLTAATFGRWKAARLAIWNALIRNGVRGIIVGTVFPNGGAASTEKRRLTIAFNNWVRAQVAANPRLALWDGYSALVDVNNATAGETVSRFFKPDSLHLTVPGAYVAAKKGGLVAAIAKFAGAPALTAQSPADVYDASYNLGGNLIPSGYGNFVGTAAGGDLAPGTGSLGLGWTNTRNAATMACVCTSPSDGSPITRTDRPEEKWQRFVVTGTAATLADYFQCYLKTPTAPGSGYAVGDKVQFSGVMRLSALSNILSVNVKLLCVGSNVEWEVLKTPGSYAVGSLESADETFVFTGAAFTIPAGTTGIKPIITIMSGAGSSAATVDVQDFLIRNITNA